MDSFQALCLSGLLIVSCTYVVGKAVYVMHVCARVWVLMCMYICMCVRWMQHDPCVGEESVLKSHKVKGSLLPPGSMSKFGNHVKTGLTEAGHLEVLFHQWKYLEIVCTQLFVCWVGCFFFLCVNNVTLNINIRDFTL